MSLTYSGYSSVRKRKRIDRQLRFAGTRRSSRRIVTSRAPRTDGQPSEVLKSGLKLLRLASVASPLARIPNARPCRGKPARRVVDTAAGLLNGGSAENDARRM